MSLPIAYTYDADTHCPECAVARFGREEAPGPNGPVLMGWPPESATDSEGNGVGAIAPWDEWHEPNEPGRFTLVCGTCQCVIATCDHEPAACKCDACQAASEYENEEATS